MPLLQSEVRISTLSRRQIFFWEVLSRADIRRTSPAMCRSRVTFTRLRQRTRKFSAKLISEGISRVISSSFSMARGSSVQSKAPRALRFSVNPRYSPLQPVTPPEREGKIVAPPCARKERVHCSCASGAPPTVYGIGTVRRDEAQANAANKVLFLTYSFPLYCCSAFILILNAGRSRNLQKPP
jgi:hypothetical protein